MCLPAGRGEVQVADACLHQRDPAAGDRELVHAEADQYRNGLGVGGQLAAHSDPAAMVMGRFHRHPNQPQNRRVQAVRLGGQCAVTAVDGQGVLRQVIGANGKEIHLGGQALGQQGTGGHLDHDPDLEVGDRNVRLHPVDDRPGRPELRHILHHGEHDAQGAVAGGGQQGPHLGFENVRPGQGQPDAAHPQERVVLPGQGPVVQRFVTAYVQGPGHQRPSVQGRKRLPVLVDLRLQVRAPPGVP